MTRSAWLTNAGGRSSFQNVGRTERNGAELSLRLAPSAPWRTQWALTLLDATYLDGFLACAGVPCAAPSVPVPAGNRIVGTQRGLAFAAARPAAGQATELALEARAASALAANDTNTAVRVALHAARPARRANATRSATCHSSCWRGWTTPPAGSAGRRHRQRRQWPLFRDCRAAQRMLLAAPVARVLAIRAKPQALTMTPMPTALPPADAPLAAIDMGSNSFRLEIGQMLGGTYRRIDYLKESVRLGAGLDGHGLLTDEASERGLACLRRFAQRLSGPNGLPALAPTQVRAVATQTLREAKNRDAFLLQAQAALGQPIEVISGREEARLIYSGVVHLQPSNVPRLVIDIGGRSTEMILGRGLNAASGRVVCSRLRQPDAAALPRGPPECQGVPCRPGGRRRRVGRRARAVCADSTGARRWALRAPPGPSPRCWPPMPSTTA